MENRDKLVTYMIEKFEEYDEEKCVQIGNILKKILDKKVNHVND